MSFDKAIELIPEILERLYIVEKQNQLLINELLNSLDLTKASDVAKYLNISLSTLRAMLKDGRFQEGIHFKKEFKNKRNRIVFVESSIVKYKGKK